MSKLVPENMVEIKQKLHELNQHTHVITEDQLIQRTIKTLIQDYLDAAEEGHYDETILNDTCNQIDVYDINNQVVDSIKSEKDNFIEDFKADAFKLTFKFEKFADYVAKQ